MNDSRISSSINRGRTRSRLVGMTIVGWPPVPRSAWPGRFGSQKRVMMVDTRRGEEGSGSLRFFQRQRQDPACRRDAFAPRDAIVASPQRLPLPGPRLLRAQQRSDADAQLLGRAALALRDAGEHLLERGGVAQAGVAALAALEVGADLVGAPRCELAVQVLEDAGERLAAVDFRSEEHTSELQSRENL